MKNIKLGRSLTNKYFFPLLDDKYKWIPSEAKECRHIIDKSDCWSLGCVMVNLLICGFNKEGKNKEIMTSVRSSGEIPIEILEDIQKVNLRFYNHLSFV